MKDYSRITNISIVYKEEVHGISRQPVEIEVEVISAIYVLKKSGMWEDTDQLSKDEMEEIVSSVMNKMNKKFHIFQIYFIIQVKQGTHHPYFIIQVKQGTHHPYFIIQVKQGTHHP